MLSLTSQTIILPMLALALPLLVVLLFAFKLALHSWHVKRHTQEVPFAGLNGRAESNIGKTGTVFVRGELWYACSKTPIQKGAIVRVVGYRNLMLEVEAEQ